MMKESDFKSVGGGVDMFRQVAKIAIEAQKVNASDYIADDGLLHCGVCKEPKRKHYQYKEMIGSVEIVTPVEITASCLCERTRQKDEKDKSKAEVDMQKIQGLRKQSLMDAKFSGVSFDTLMITPHNQKNLKWCRSYANRFEEMLAKPQGLLLWGNVGTGKSFAAAAIANQLLSKQIPVIMTSFASIVEDIQSRRLNEQDFLESLSCAKLVIFDDLGTERKTTYASEVVHRVIDDRYRKKLPVIITTNITLPDMQAETDSQYGRIYDRIFEMCFPIQFTGPSWRRKIAHSNYEKTKSLFDDDE